MPQQKEIRPFDLQVSCSLLRDVLVELITWSDIADSYRTRGDAKKAAHDSLAALRDTRRSIGERAANAISIFDELAQNPKMPSYTRVGLWTALSKLETIRE